VTETTIRRLTPEETTDAMFPLTSYAFHASPPFRDRKAWEEAIQQRKDVIYLALFEDERAVATVAGSPMTQQVRGALYRAGAVWGVVTDPAARRQGHCRRLMTRLVAAQRGEGWPLSCLYPFRASFYERMGYVKFPLTSKVSFEPGDLRSLLKRDLLGTVERMLIGDGYDAYRSYVKRLQGRMHGFVVFLHGEKERAQKENRSWLALAKVDGEVEGLMLYRLEGEHVTDFTLRASRFYYDTSRGKYLLLQWIARHVDQASEVQLWLPPFERPETWWADIQLSAEAPARGPMGRVVDVNELGGMRTGPGCFTARVRDPLCSWNEGMWRLETVDGRLEVTPASHADVDLTIQALAALIYGTHDPADFAFRGWGDPSPDLQATMRAMYPPRLPYLHEYF
jgi:predicted acetyltransferase